MRIVIDERKYKRRALLSRVLLFSSIGLLLLGLVITLFAPQLGLLTPSNTWLFFALYTLLLMGGFVLSRIGMHFGNRYLSPSRPDAVLRDSLKGLDRKYALLIFQGLTDYLLVEPGGVTVFVVRNQDGKITFRDGKWKRRESLLRYWFGRDEPLGDPIEDLKEELARVSRALSDKLPDLKIPVRGIIVFSHPRVVLDVEGSPFPVLRADDLKDYLRGAGRLKELPNSIQRKVRESLGAPELPKPEPA
ncbi:MAG: hypothetical protein RMJ86_02825 [Anaerolineae bacterium]|nr:hypothetical protein [Thermoflexales bacterium]MCX7939197.1 hypothetical protein [Thermoflexales bacterium]MDW8053466.1 hypothetical protein [Anaerolineae bacterium]MDW8293216.1 hypothetical protein [Anaerolineae bacterium]